MTEAHHPDDLAFARRYTGTSVVLGLLGKVRALEGLLKDLRGINWGLGHTADELPEPITKEVIDGWADEARKLYAHNRVMRESLEAIRDGTTGTLNAREQAFVTLSVLDAPPMPWEKEAKR